MKINWLFIVIMLLTMGLTLYFGLSKQTNEMNNQVDQKPDIGFLAPSFSLPGLHTDQQYALDNINQPLVINFWASWCQPCQLEAPELVRLYEEYQGDIEIYGINLTDSDNLTDVERFVDEFGIEFPVLLDEKGTVSEAYQVLAIPTTFFVNADGVIENKIIGLASQQKLEAGFRNLARK